MTVFNYQRFLQDKWGDPDRLTAFLHDYGHKEIKRATVNQWFRRRSVPSDAFALLVALLKVERGDIGIEAYLE